MGKFLSVRETLQRCRSLGWTIGKVETPGRYSRNGFVTPGDLFGFADLVAIVPGRTGTTYIQATAGGHASERVDKMLNDAGENVETVLNAGNYVEMWCWVLRKAQGKTRRGLPSARKVRDAIRWDFRIEFGELVAERVQDYLGFAEEFRNGLDSPILDAGSV